jgi:hypothetical protein
MIWGAARRRAGVDAAVAAYTQGRSERDAVRTDVRQPDEPRWAPSGDRSRASMALTQALPGAW